MRASGKKSKVVGASTVKSVKKLVAKLIIFEKMLMHIKEYGVLKGLEKLYDKFSEDEKSQIEDAVVFMMKKYSKALTELQGKISNSLYDKLDARW